MNNRWEKRGENDCTIIKKKSVGMIQISVGVFFPPIDVWILDSTGGYKKIQASAIVIFVNYQ